MSNPRVVEPYGIVLSEAQRRILATAARQNGRLFWAKKDGHGRGVRGRWNVLQTLEALELSCLTQADGKAGYYEWELTNRGHEVGLALPLPVEEAA